MGRQGGSQVMYPVTEANPFPKGGQQIRNWFGPNVQISFFLTKIAAEKFHRLWDS